ncbi:MAG TPA: rhomboid family intramembrane serine protease [Gemmatimonadaceae bacterium]
MSPWVFRLIVANLVMFFVTGSSPNIGAMLAFRPMYVLEMPWTPVTYMFVHGGLGHIAFNMLSLYFFGPQVERRLGSPAFLSLYLFSGLGGAALSFLTPTVSIVGASGAVFGVVLAFARYWPNQRIYLYAVLPIEARFFVVGTFVYELWAGVSGRMDGIAHYAHLGGYAGAFLFLWWHGRSSARAEFQRRVEKATYGGPAAARPTTPDWGLINREGLHPLNIEELDRIERKIADEGSGSLTPDERAFLHRLSSR